MRAGGDVSVKVKADGRDEWTIEVTQSLATMFAWAHEWSQTVKPDDKYTLSFSTMLAAMAGGDDPLCAWFRSHLALRGVPPERLTQGRPLYGGKLPAPAWLSVSMVKALEMASELRRLSGGTLDVRHFMAAYAVIKDYHLGDFLRLRIDRRAWCLELGEELERRFPDESSAWAAYRLRAVAVPELGFDPDVPDGRDLLNIDREVEAFSRLIVSRSTQTPLSIGVFGAWGSGKSFFMRRVRERVAALSAEARGQGTAAKNHGQVAQIDFNAWHYSEGNLAACFVDHIFRNLRFDAPNEDDAKLQERSNALVRQLDAAKQSLEEREKAYAEAEKQHDAAKQQLVELGKQIDAALDQKRAELTTAQTSLDSAQKKLNDGLSALKTELDAELDKVPAKAVFKLAEAQLANPEFTKATTAVKQLVDHAKQTSGQRKLILAGMFVVALGVVTAAILKSNVYTQLVALAGTVTAFTATAGKWLGKLDELATKGKELETKQQELIKEVTDKVTEDHKTALDGLRALVATKVSAVDAVTAEIAKLQQAPVTAQVQVDELEAKRSAALAAQVAAAAEVEARKRAVDRLTTGTLLDEFLSDRAATDGYRRELTLFSQIRNDFERLSHLMEKAADSFYAGKGDPPPVTRIVLYIDDLDRCAPERVIEVIKLVHLLLAFPLFVCVVAVDPRWITHCLAHAPGVDRGAIAAPEQLGDPATAADYLEKVFQIPLWLRPVPVEQRAAVVRMLLDPAQPRANASDPAADRPSLVVSAVGSTAKTAATPSDPPAAHDPDKISRDELAFLDELGSLLDGNPRALKRFVNTYRLVKTALSDVELQVFHAPVRMTASHQPDRREGTYSPYRLCMAQLAVLCTQRNRALAMVREIDAAPPETWVVEWLAGLEKGKDQNLADLAKCFRKTLGSELDGADISTFKLWLERTRRYSFYL